MALGFTRSRCRFFLYACVLALYPALCFAEDPDSVRVIDPTTFWEGHDGNGIHLFFIPSVEVSVAFTDRNEQELKKKSPVLLTDDDKK